MRPAREPAFPRRWAALIAFGGGLAGVVAFPRFGIWPSALLSVAALSVAVSGRRARTAAWIGYLFGLAFLVPLVQWTGIFVGPFPWLLLCAADATFFALLAAVLTVLERLPLPPLWVGAGWVLEEFLRDRLPFGGFPWGRLAFSQAQSPLRWYAALGGAPLVTFLVAVAGAGLALTAQHLLPWRGRPVLAGVVTLGAVVLVALGLSGPLAPPADSAGRTLRIAVIQGGLPDLGLDFEQRARQVLDNHVARTRELARLVRSGRAPRPDLVLWPENASDVDAFLDAPAYREIDTVVKEVGAPVLVGMILQGPGPTHRRNVGILWSPTTGPGARYVKRHPVPFAEYIPLRGVAEALSSQAKNVTQDMVAGHGNGLLRGGRVPIGDVICFEVGYDDLVRSSVAAGAQLLVVQTNNATFGHSPETYQQLAMSQLRAVEHGRTVVQATTTGLSAVIGPDGRIRVRSGALFTPAILQARVPVRSAQTLATRLGAWPEYLLSLAALAGVIIVGLSQRRLRSTDPATPRVQVDGGRDVQERMVHR